MGCIAPDVLDAAVLVVEAQEVPVWGAETSAEPVGTEYFAVILAVLPFRHEDMDHEILPLPVRIDVVRLTDCRLRSFHDKLTTG